MPLAFRLRVVPIVLLAAMAGCGPAHPGLVPVAGTVTIDGEPVKTGQVKIIAEGQRAAVGKIGEDGSFSISSYKLNDGAPTGTHLATVTAVESIDERSNRWYAPKRYADQTQSDLWVTIDGPTDDLKIELTWDGSGKKGPYVDKF